MAQLATPRISNGVVNGGTLPSGNTFDTSTTKRNSSNFEEDVSTMRPTATDLIAICGLGVRLPGGITSGDSFWDVIRNGQDLQGPIPPSRFNAEGFSRALGTKGAFDISHGYFINNDLAASDGLFFTGTKDEKSKMDPQLRQLLEVAKECLDNAGEADYRGKRTGVFVGTFGDDWIVRQSRAGLQHTGGFNASFDLFLANKISFEFGLTGPSMVIKTGCSASLVAVHQACLALQAADCDAALVGGASLLMDPQNFAVMAAEGILSPEGSCKPFDARADGFARAEAINMVLLKRLDDAQRDGNPIRAVIRGTGTNSNGKSGSLWSPDTASQEALIRRTYALAGLNPVETGFFECHGTGTPAGDPIEASAVGNIFGEQGITIGSVKANVGHGEGASGITSLIKAILMLEKKMIPPSIKFEEANPNIPYLKSRLMINTSLMTWPEERAERVSINSFGIGGSNAHVIVESLSCTRPGPALPAPVCNNTRPHTNLLVLSAHSASSLEQLMDSHKEYAEAHPEHVQDLAYTLSQRREHLSHRSFVLWSTSQLSHASFTPSVRSSHEQESVVMVFTGQGAQWPQMAADLLRQDDKFREDFASLDCHLRRLANPPTWSLSEELARPAMISNVYTAEYAQPLCTAVQICIVKNLRRCGVQPTAVVGHSSGEIAAAFAAGALTESEAITIAFCRGLIMRETSNAGSMAAIGLGSNIVADFLVEGAVVAAENSPSSTTVSGEVKAVDSVIAKIKAQHPDAFTRRLQVDVAYHSPQMINVAKTYLRYLQDTLESESIVPRVPFFSTTTGSVHRDAFRLSYWCENLVSKVCFTSAIRELYKSQKDPLLLEVGPHPQLAGPLRQIVGDQLKYVSTLYREKMCSERLLITKGQLFQRGVKINFTPFIPRGRVLYDLPLYPWDRSTRTFYEPRPSVAWRTRKYGHHALLGQRSPESSDLEPSWRVVLDLSDEPWLVDHRVGNDIVFPFAGYVAMAGEAVRQISGKDDGYTVKHVIVHGALLLRPDQPAELVTTLRRRKITDTNDSNFFDFQITSITGANTVKHCDGQVSELSSDCPVPLISQNVQRKVSNKSWYEAVDRAGYRFGASFQTLANVHASATEDLAVARVTAFEEAKENQFTLHPVIIDGLFQVLFVALAKGLCKNARQLYLPSSLEEATIRRHRGPLQAQAQAFNENDSVDGTIVAVCDGHLVAKMQGFTLKPLQDGKDDAYDIHAAANIKWYPHLETQDLCLMLTPPLSSIDERKILEEMVSIAIIDCHDRTRDSSSPLPHLHKLQKWLEREYNSMLGHGGQSVDASRYLDMSPLERETRLRSLHESAQTGDFSRSSSTGVLRIWKYFEDIFNGRTDALQVLMEDGLLTELYSAITFNFSAFVEQLCIARPGLRILEIGAGTGGTTAEVFKHIVKAGAQPSFANYTFTDVSASFFVAAKERFRDIPNMTYTTYDISQDPLKQGFQAGSYDLIVAANVIHTVSSLGVTLSYLRQLIHPGGYLLMTEVTTESNLPSFIFGNFPGWWMGEKDGRYWAPYVSLDRWKLELDGAGLEGISASVLDCEEPYNWTAAILSRVPYPSKEDLEVTIVSRDMDHAIARRLCEDFNAIGIATTRLPFGASLPRGSTVITTLDLEGSFFDNISEGEFQSFQDFCRTYKSQECLWLLTPCHFGCAEPRTAQSLGALQVARSEMDLSVFTLEISLEEPEFARLVSQVVTIIRRGPYSGNISCDMEFIVDKGILKVPRVEEFSLRGELRERSPPDESNVSMEIGTPGMLSTLRWCRETLEPLGDGDVEVHVRAVGLNFKDLVDAMGLLDKKHPRFGFEITGHVSQVGSAVNHLAVGDRIVAFWDKSLSNIRRLPASFCVKLPAHIAFDEAATFMAVYVTVLHSLVDVGNIQVGQSVLVHSACGGVGHAAISLCRYLGVDEIYATVGTDKKIEYAVQTLGLPRHRIFDSRSESFYSGLMAATNGRGVDVVLNSLSGQLLHTSWRCVAEFGRMIELGKRDLASNGQLDLLPFLKNRAFIGVDLAALLDKRPKVIQNLINRVMELYSNRKLMPLPKICFSAEIVESAFRCLQSGDHIGKVVVIMPDNVDTLQTEEPQAMAVTFPSYTTYLLTGGFGGLGRSIITWMVERGARNFVVISPTAGRKKRDLDFIAELVSLGCTIVPIAGRVEDMETVQLAISKAPSPIQGVFHLAMAQKESPLLDLTHKDWTAVIKPKVDGAWNLHDCLRGQNLSFFVLASSLLVLIHQPNESNYAASSTFLESFCQWRRAQGLPSSLLSICALTDVGFVAERPSTRRNLQNQGVYFLTENEFLDFVELAILDQRPRSAEILQNKDLSSGWIGMGVHSTLPMSDPKNRLGWRNDPKMGFFHNILDDYNTKDHSTPAGQKLASFLDMTRDDPTLLSSPEHVEFLAAQIMQQLLSVIGHGEVAFDLSVSLRQLGVDSLLSIELKRWWKLTFGIEISVLEIMGCESINELGVLTARKLEEKVHTRSS